jgi:zinc transporter ZupT
VTPTFTAVLLASSLACGITAAGIYVISRYEEWAKRRAVHFQSFAAGVLISVALIHLVPKSLSMVDSSPLLFLVGFLALYLSNRFLTLHADHGDDGPDPAVGLIPMIGIGLHSFVDGVIYSVTFKVDLFTGGLTAVGMILHEFPEGVVVFVLLTRGGFETRKAFLCAFLASGLSTPAGALISYPFVSRVQPFQLGALLALSAGALLYVGATHLLPRVEQENPRYSVLTLAAGVAVAAVVVLFHRVHV